jgi:hypothetical protein
VDARNGQNGMKHLLSSRTVPLTFHQVTPQTAAREATKLLLRARPRVSGTTITSVSSVSRADPHGLLTDRQSAIAPTPTPMRTTSLVELPSSLAPAAAAQTTPLPSALEKSGGALTHYLQTTHPIGID